MILLFLMDLRCFEKSPKKDKITWRFPQNLNGLACVIIFLVLPPLHFYPAFLYNYIHRIL